MCSEGMSDDDIRFTVISLQIQKWQWVIIGSADKIYNED